jgi:hypothetical protein
MLFFPLLLILTPSPSKSTQSILYALSAPVRHGPIKGPAPIQLSQPAPGNEDDKKKKEGKMEEEVVDPRRSGVGGGDVVRDCAVVEYVFLSFFLLSSFSLSSSFLLPESSSNISFFSQAMSRPVLFNTISYYGWGS